MQGWFLFKEPVVLLLRIMGLSERSQKRILSLDRGASDSVRGFVRLPHRIPGSPLFDESFHCAPAMRAAVGSSLPGCWSVQPE
jgi:hypothetical protein